MTEKEKPEFQFQKDVEAMTQKYILDDDHNLVPVDLMTWAKWFGEADRRVAGTEVGGLWISTVFLGINHQWDAYGPPLLFETMVFSKVKDPSRYGDGEGWGGEEDMARYATWDEAIAGHAAMVAKYTKEEDV